MKKPRCAQCNEIIRKYQVTDPITKKPYCSWECMKEGRIGDKLEGGEVTEGEVWHAKRVIKSEHYK